MKARILPLIDGRYMPMIKTLWFMPWRVADRQGDYLWPRGIGSKWCICGTLLQAKDVLALYGVQHTDLVP